MSETKKKRGRPKKIRVKFIKRVPKEKKFIISNGSEISNIKELADILTQLQDDVFMHHVNEHKNDFSEWIKYVHSDHALAEKIQNIRDKNRMQILIYQHIAENLW